MLLFFAPIMKVPKLNREALYRRLLETFVPATSDAAFAIDAEKEEVFVRALRRLSGSTTRSSRTCCDTVGKVADTWDDALREEFGGR